MNIYKVLLFVVSFAVFVYTISYAIWEWKNNNRFGSAFVYILSFIEIGLSLYAVVI